MVRGKFVSDTDNIDIAENIRRAVLVDECHTEISADHRITDLELLVYDVDLPVGSGYVGINDDLDFVIGGVAILPKYRNQKYGDFLVRILIDKAMMSNATAILTDALAGTEGFFETIGFVKTGAAYEADGARWTPMKIDTSSIHKCCNCNH